MEAGAQTLKPGATAARGMPEARRVLLAPPAAWDEPRLLEAVRAIPETTRPLRPGDDLAGLVVLSVDPAPGAAAGRATTFDVQPAPRALRAPQVDVAVLLDASESMALPWSADLTRMDAAREALSSFLHGDNAGVASVTVLSYARDARILATGIAPGSGSMIDAPAPAGPSRTDVALDAALAHLLAHARPDRVQAILLLADGIGDPDATLDAAARAGRLRVPIHALVFAPEADPVFAEAARLSGGSVQLAAIPLTVDFVHEPGGTPA